MDFIQTLSNVQRINFDIAFVSIYIGSQVVSYASGGGTRQFGFSICIHFDQQLLVINSRKENTDEGLSIGYTEQIIFSERVKRPACE